MNRQRQPTSQEFEKALLGYYKESDSELKSLSGNLKVLHSLKRERLYFILAIVFGLLFNLSATAIDSLVQSLSSNPKPTSLYFTYASIVIALSFTSFVWMIGKIRDLGQYIILNQNIRQKKNKVNKV